MATVKRHNPRKGSRRRRASRAFITVAGGVGVLLLSSATAAPASADGPTVPHQPTSHPAALSLTCQRMVVVPDGASMWTMMPHLRPGDCVQTATGWVPPPPPPPQHLTDHCTAVTQGTAPGRVQSGNNRGHLKGGDEMFEGDQHGSPPRPAPRQADVVFAAPAYDTIRDYGGDNCLYGEEGADWIHGGSGDDLVDGGKGADTLYGGQGDDYIMGDADEAIPQRQDGSPPTNVDLLDGGAGDDILIGGFGVDEMYGGPGNDLCIGSVGGNPADNDAPPPGSDIWVSTGVDPEGRPTGSWLNKYHGCETIWTKTQAPNGLQALLVVDGGGQPTPAGPHSLWPRVWTPGPVLSEAELHDVDVAQAASLQADLRHALDTADDYHRPLLEQALARLDSYSTADYPTCGQPTQIGTNDDNYLGGANDAGGSDRMYGVKGNNRIDGFAGEDCLNGGAGNDVLFGGKGGDVFYGGPGDEHLVGGADSDLLYGGEGNDWLYGGTSDDIIDGGPGVNHCFGQSGHDVFINCQYIVSGLDEQTGNWGDVVRY